MNAIVSDLFITSPFYPVMMKVYIDYCSEVKCLQNLWPNDRWTHAQHLVNDVIHVRKIENHFVIHFALPSWGTRLDRIQCRKIVPMLNLTNFACFSMISLNNRSWTSGFLASKKAEFVSVVAVVSKPANKNNSDWIDWNEQRKQQSSMFQQRTWEMTISSTSSLSQTGTSLPPTVFV